MRRRNFSGAVAATSLGLGLDALDVQRLTALLGSGSAPSTARKIGAADVEATEQATAVLRQWQFRSGGGLSRSAAVAQFRSVLPLLAGDLGAGVHTGHQAVHESAALAATRHHDRLRTLTTVLAPHATEPAVSDLRADIGHVVAAA